MSDRCYVDNFEVLSLVEKWPQKVNEIEMTDIVDSKVHLKPLLSFSILIEIENPCIID